MTRRPDAVLAGLVGAGLLGSLTTFSTFAIEVVEIGDRSGLGAGLVYAGFSITLGIGLSAIGFRRGRAER